MKRDGKMKERFDMGIGTRRRGTTLREVEEDKSGPTQTEVKKKIWRGKRR